VGKSVKDAMTSDVKTATPSQTLTDAAMLMKQEDVGSVPVVDGERLIGMLTDRDIVVRGIADGSDPHAIQIGDIASRDVVTVRPDDDLDEALRLMAQHHGSGDAAVSPLVTRLRRADCSAPGITRRRRGRGFEYLDAAGGRIDDFETLERIRALVIPPAWTDVWICPDPNGHLQATGTDVAGRRQYRYHDRWRERRDQQKFDEMLAFARALPRLRRAAATDLHERGRRRELACAVRLLDRGFFRIGGEEYADGNGSHGLATLTKRHVQLGDSGVLVFDYPAKSGKRRLQAVVDPEVYDVVAALKRRRGERLFHVRSQDINAYIKDATRGDFSAKDFRTWHATVLAAVALAVSERAASPTGRKRAISRAVKEVAHYLGNTPAVCRASYIDPRVFDRYRAGITISPALDGLAETDEERAPATQGAIERAVLKLLEDEPRLRAVRRAA
jgi:DNA topoisomerase IB